MNEGTAYKMGEKMMEERGLCEKDWIFRYRHIFLDAGETKTLDGINNLFIIVDWSYSIKVESKAGIYDLTDSGINEQQHVHRGLIELRNTGLGRSAIRFLQIIPIEKKNDDE